VKSLAPAMRLLVGLTLLIGNIERYAERFDFLELRADSERLPSPKALRRMRAAAPNLGMSLLLPPRMTASLLDASELPQKLTLAAEALAANWVVVQTGPDLGPSSNNRARLAALVERLRSPTRRIAWEPRGPWEEDAARAEAEILGVTLVQDLSVTEGYSDKVVYTRLRTLGPGAQLRAGALENLAEELAEAEEATVVIEGRPNQRARSKIAAAIAGTRSALEDEDDEEDDEELDEEEDDGVLESGSVGPLESGDDDLDSDDSDDDDDDEDDSDDDDDDDDDEDDDDTKERG
jgi:hypothetical protein